MQRTALEHEYSRLIDQAIELTDNHNRKSYLIDEKHAAENIAEYEYNKQFNWHDTVLYEEKEYIYIGLHPTDKTYHFIYSLVLGITKCVQTWEITKK